MTGSWCPTGSVAAEFNHQSKLDKRLQLQQKQLCVHLKNEMGKERPGGRSVAQRNLPPLRLIWQSLMYCLICHMHKYYLTPHMFPTEQHEQLRVSVSERRPEDVYGWTKS